MLETNNATTGIKGLSDMYSKKFGAFLAYLVFMSQSPNAIDLAPVITKSFIWAICIQGALDLVKYIIEYLTARKQKGSL